MRQKTIYIDPLDMTSYMTDYITNRAKTGCDMHKVVVGPDIHPDWD